eukprot:6191625-Pleurochrysis_carterae.AAC.2
MLALAKFGLHSAPAKVLVGDAANALGFHIRATSGRLCCSDGKRGLLLETMAEMHEEAADRGRVHWLRARTLTDRLANLAQAYPELKAVLRGAYAVSQPPRQREHGDGGWRCADEWRPLASGGVAEAEGLFCLDVAQHLLLENERRGAGGAAKGFPITDGGWRAHSGCPCRRPSCLACGRWRKGQRKRRGKRCAW